MPFQISINASSSDIHRHYHEGISLVGKYEIGLKSFVTLNNIPNITERNNVIKLNHPSDPSKNVEILIPVGSYSLSDISYVIKNLCPEAEWKAVLNEHTNKLEVYSKYDIDFSSDKSIGSILGFSKQILKAEETYYSDSEIELYSINTIKVKCNLIRCNFQDLHRHDNTIYEFPLTSTYGEKIIERPTHISYFTLITDTIHELSLRVVDRNNTLIDFCNHQINIVLDLRPKKDG